MLLVFFTTENRVNIDIFEQSTLTVKQLAPFILVGIAIWFTIAYFANTTIIRSATGARPLERKENKRVYNLVENLCMAQGMSMPKINLIEDNSLNAFASGVDKHSYTVTLSRGIINKLDDDELESVIAHELSHIRNRDVRLLIVSIVFVGIFAMLAQIAINILRYMPKRSRSNNKNGGGIIVIVLIALVVAAIGYFFATLMRFAISRNREFMADAGAAEMTRRPQALASALRKISQNPDIKAVTRDDIAQLFIEHPCKNTTGKKSRAGISGLFATHPPIEKRIAVLEQF
jgi:heat shock protein HtpX